MPFAPAAPEAVELHGPELPAPREVRAFSDRFLTWTPSDAGMLVERGHQLLWTDAAGGTRRTLACPGMDKESIVEASAPDTGHLVGVLLTSGRVCVWDLRRDDGPAEVRTRAATHFALAPSALALGFKDGAVELRAWPGDTTTWTRDVHQGSITALAFNSSGDRLALAASRRGAALIDPRSGRLLRAFGRGPAWSVAFDEAHRRVAAGFEDGLVQMRWIDDGRDAGSLHVGSPGVGGERVEGVDFTGDGDDLAVRLSPPPPTLPTDPLPAGTLAVWNLPNATLSMRVPLPSPAPGALLRFTPYGATLAATDGADWGRVWLRPELPWRPQTRALAAPATHRSLAPEAPSLSPLALPATIPTPPASSGDQPAVVPPPVSGEMFTATARDPAHPGRMAVGTADGGVRFIGVGRRGMVATRGTFSAQRLEVGDGPVRRLAFTPEGARVVVVSERPGGAGALLTILAEDPNETARPFVVLDRVPEAIEVSTDGRHVLAWDAWTVQVFDTTGATLQFTLSAATARAGFGESPNRVEVVDPRGIARRYLIAGGAVAWVPRGARVALTENGMRAAVQDGDIVELWQGRKAYRLGVFPPAGQAITTVAIAPTGRTIAVRYADGDVETYDAGRIEVDRRYATPVANGEVGAPWVRYSDDGRVVWTSAGPRTFIGWRLADGVEVDRLVLPGEGPLVPDPTVRSPRFVALLPDHGEAAPEAWIDLGADAVRRVFLAAEGRRPLAMAPATTRIAWAHDGVVSQANLRGGLPPTGPIPVPDGAPVAAAFSERGDRLAIAGSDGLVRVYDDRGVLCGTVDPRGSGATGRPAAPLVRIEFERGDALDFEAGDEYLRTTDAAGWARRWQWATGTEAHVVSAWPGSVAVATDIRAAVITPGGTRLYTGDADGLVRGWDLSTGAQIALNATAPGAITGMAVDETGATLAIADAGGAVRLLDGQDLHERSVVPGFESGPVTLTISTVEQRFTALSSARILRTWSTATATSTGRWQLPAARSDGPADIEHDLSLALGGLATGPAPARFGWRLPDGERLVVVGEDGRVRIWSLADRQLLGTLLGLDDGGWVLDRADGRRISSPSLRDQTAEPHG